MKQFKIFTVAIMIILLSIFVFAGNTFAEKGKIPVGNGVFTGMGLMEVKQVVNMNGSKLKVYSHKNNLILLQKVNTDVLFVFSNCDATLLAKAYVSETDKVNKFKNEFKKNKEIRSMKKGGIEYLRSGDAGYRFTPFNEEGTATLIWTGSISRWNKFIEYCNQSPSNKPFPLF